ncbi:MAG: glycosyltransferase family 4 protein [Actinomycetota bacterium]
MRVLIIAEDLDAVGGVAQSTLALAEGLQARGHRIGLIFGNDGSLTSRWLQVTRNLRRLGSVQLPRREPARSTVKLARAISFSLSFRPDLVYCHSMNQLPIATVIGRTTRKPVVMHLRTAAPIDRPRNHRRLRRVSTFMAVSQAARGEWVKFDDHVRSRCSIVPPGISLAALHPASEEARSAARKRFGLRTDLPVLTFIGRIAEEKGIRELVVAHRQFPGLQLLVVGGEAGKEQPLTRELRLVASPMATFLGPIPDITNVYAAADAVVVPSHLETFGRVVVEGLACGLPVIAARTGGIPEILAEQFDEYLFDKVNAKEISAKIREVMPFDNSASFRQRARAVAEKYSDTRVVDSVEKVLLWATS